MVTIAHISDLHVGSVHFVPNLMNRVIGEINELKPDLIVCTGDITDSGLIGEFKTAKAYLDQFDARIVAVPGNHDSKNVGWVHFEELIGPRHWRVELPEDILIIGVDSSEPDLNEGQVGREAYPWIIEQLSAPARMRIYVQHHHLMPIPGAGRERSTVADAGDLLEILIRSNVNLALTGHKHVPWVWRLEDLYISNSGTASSLKVRGHTKPCYNIIRVNGSEVTITQKLPFGPGQVIAHFDVDSGEQYHRELEAIISEDTTTA